MGCAVAFHMFRSLCTIGAKSPDPHSFNDVLIGVISPSVLILLFPFIHVWCFKMLE
jgi:hypothetical protein